MDCCDYPLDTVPKVVDKIFKSQIWHNIATHIDYKNVATERNMGFGALTSTFKMTKLLVEAGVAMFHLDDLAIGKKKFTVGQGRTVVPTSEYLDRLIAARMQIDIMGTETILLCCCEVDHSEFITDVIDARDHKYAQGATVPVKSLQETLKAAAEDGSQNLLKIRKEWITSAKLCTFEEEVRALATKTEHSAYTTGLGISTQSLKGRRATAKETVCKEIFFDWDLPREREGQFFYKSSISAIVERALLAAPLGDVTWTCMDMPNWNDLVSFHTQICAVFPNRLFACFSAEAVKTFPSDLAKIGVAWQVQPIWALQGINHVTEKFATLWRERGIEGYVEEVQKPALAMRPLTDGFEKPSYSGSYLCDAFWDTVAVRDVGEGADGKISEKRIRGERGTVLTVDERIDLNSVLR